jgi:hypothetical protein
MNEDIPLDFMAENKPPPPPLHVGERAAVTKVHGCTTITEAALTKSHLGFGDITGNLKLTAKDVLHITAVIDAGRMVLGRLETNAHRTGNHFVMIDIRNLKAIPTT